MSLLILLLVAIAFALFAWPTRWRYEHITIEKESYLVRIDRISGHADILVPELGWVPADQPWDEFAPPAGAPHTSVVPL